jgi:iron complex transport system ATP-binding protein
MTAALSATDIGLDRTGRRVLDAVSFAFTPGETVALLGPNGAGKTTLIRILLGLLRPDRGHVALDGEPIASLPRRTVARRIAYVPQQHRAIFPFGVREMVGMGRTPMRGLAATRDTDRAVDEALAQANIGHLADRRYTALSGGEQRSVLIARALAQGARILILDEPAAALDPGQRHRLTETLRALGQSGYTILASLHEPEEARRAFGRAIMLKDGRIVADGASSTVLTPRLLAETFDLPDPAPLSRGAPPWP